ncbi:Hypothetical predicted protein [Cloeon dipterum]|nr:Hypothetical predicted protein [Cloeon dipterum]
MPLMEFETEEFLSWQIFKESCLFTECRQCFHISRERSSSLHDCRAPHISQLINRIRRSKKLLVLDLDHTLINDDSDEVVPVTRPYLRRFLTSVYKHYNLAIWSASSMKRIKRVLKELALDKDQRFRFSFLVCHKAMRSVKKGGKCVTTKPLAVIWENFCRWSAKNTIIIDDKGENFLRNPREGLKIKRFECERRDRELRKLSVYLRKISKYRDFRVLNHKKWKNCY